MKRKANEAISVLRRLVIFRAVRWSHPTVYLCLQSPFQFMRNSGHALGALVEVESLFTSFRYASSIFCGTDVGRTNSSEANYKSQYNKSVRSCLQGKFRPFVLAEKSIVDEHGDEIAQGRPGQHIGGVVLAGLDPSPCRSS